LLSNPRRSTKKGKRVLVVGAGCAGLGAAWHLNRAGVDVTLFEELGKLGGHANTINGKFSQTTF
jgi:predicted NAD/FAD-binding protein